MLDFLFTLQDTLTPLFLIIIAGFVCILWKKYNRLQKPLKMIKHYELSVEKAERIKSNFKNEIANFDTQQLSKLRQSCASQFSDLKKPLNSIDVVLPFSVGMSSLLMSFVGVLFKSAEPYLYVVVFFFMLIIVFATVHFSNGITKRQEILSLYMKSIDEVLQKQNEKPAHTVAVKLRIHRH